MSTRDTQFQGFAHAVLLELVNNHSMALNWYKFFGEIELIIARRSYDLVNHAMHKISLADFETCEYREELTETVPDMTELPKEQG